MEGGKAEVGGWGGEKKKTRERGAGLLQNCKALVLLRRIGMAHTVLPVNSGHRPRVSAKTLYFPGGETPVP